MPNQNDAEITGIYVSQQTSAGVQDDAPNAPIGGALIPGAAFDVTLEMVAGSILDTAAYTLVVSCADLTTWTNQPALVPAFPPAPSTVGAGPWKAEGSYFTYLDNQTVGVPAGGGGGQVYQYTASLITANGQVASIKQSDPFVLY
jgi:hypothetical protein